MQTPSFPRFFCLPRFTGSAIACALASALSGCGGNTGSPGSSGGGPSAGGSASGGAAQIHGGNSATGGASALASGGNVGGTSVGSGGLIGNGGLPSTAGGAASSGGSRAAGGAASGGKSGATGGAGDRGGATTGSGGRAANGGAGGAGGRGGAPSATGGASTVGGASCSSAAATGHFQMENLDRGLVAVRVGSGNYVGWRMLGYEYSREQPDKVSYTLYRDGTRLASVTNSTNYLDSAGAASASYSVSAVIDGVECAQSKAVVPWTKNYLSIPLSPPPSGTTPGGDSYAYNNSTGNVNDGSPGDVDGDGEYEIVVSWNPSNAQDNSNSGYTGPVYLDCYKLNGTRLWRINLGQNIRAGAHYTQFLVYDLDGDGRAEVAMKTAPGTKDGTDAYLSKGPAANDNDSTDYRNSGGYVLSGPEYLTVFDGKTGAELATVNFEVARGTVSSWGDEYGNRVDRFLASVGFVSDSGGAGEGSGRPSLLMARGYYTRATLSAWNFRDGQLKKIWTADSNTAGSSALVGQGAHSMAVADVDGDNAQEIIYGAAMIQSDGSFGCSTGYGHGDALHVGDLVPSRPGLEVFMPHEDTSKPIWDLRDAKTCATIQVSSTTGSDNGRGVADDILASNAGAEMWSAADSALRSCATAASVGSKPGMTNFLIWWDADELRELEDGTAINKGDGTRLLSCSDCASNNGTKSTPTLTADLFGDWREEIVWRTSDSRELRVFTTTAVTTRRIYTLMHDPQYRMQITSEQTAYNQPPHPGFHLGAGMAEPPQPNISVR